MSHDGYLQFAAVAPTTESEGSLYTSRIIKAGAPLTDTTTLFEHWNESGSVGDNLDRLQRENSSSKIQKMGAWRRGWLRPLLCSNSFEMFPGRKEA